jgi:hypothetical protein
MPTKPKIPAPAFIAVRLHRFKAVANGTSTEAERTEYAATRKGKRWVTDPESAFRFADQAEAQAVSAPFHGYATRSL